MACSNWHRPSTELMRHGRSLDHAFALGRLVVKRPIRPPFALTLFSRFLTLMRRSLGTSDLLSEVYRPSQTAHLMLSPFSRRTLLAQRQTNREISNMRAKGWCYIGALAATDVTAASLPPTLYNRHHITTSSCSKVQRGLLVPLKDS